MHGTEYGCVSGLHLISKIKILNMVGLNVTSKKCIQRKKENYYSHMY